MDQLGYEWLLAIDSADQAQVHAIPLFLRIARQISAEIQRGRLAPGSRLPGSRELAKTLGVHRNTVLAAYRELLAEGYLVSHHGRGTFVTSQLPDVQARDFRPRHDARRQTAPATADAPSDPQPRTLEPPALAGTLEGMPFRLQSNAWLQQVLTAEGPSSAASRAVTSRPDMLRMYGGVPDLRALPSEAFARAMRRVLRHSPSVLDYADPAGHRKLRAALATMLRTRRALAVDPQEVLITRGSQMGLALAAASLVRPGEVIAVEDHGYPPAWIAFKLAGAEVVPVPVDSQGLDVAALAELATRQPIRAVYVTPHHQYPTTVALSPGRRLELLALAEQARFFVLEDDYDHEFHYEGRPLLPLKSADRFANVVYIGTLSKVFAPGVRIGYVVAPAAVAQAMLERRFYLDRQGDHVTEAALAELIEEGELARHLRRMRQLYRARRDACVHLLHKHLSGTVDFTTPGGGMALWARAAPDIDVAAWSAAAERLGVAFQPGQQYRWDGQPSQHLRLGYACLTESELAEAVRRLAASLAV